jgi:DNA-binding MarR family transcriptional regulator
MLEHLDSITGKTRADIRRELGIDPSEGKTHKVFDEMEKDGLIRQIEVIVDGRARIMVELTDLGKGYLKCMHDYKIGPK